MKQLSSTLLSWERGGSQDHHDLSSESSTAARAQVAVPEWGRSFTGGPYGSATGVCQLWSYPKEQVMWFGLENNSSRPICHNDMFCELSYNLSPLTD